MLSSFNTSLRNCSYICLSLISLNSLGSTQLFTSITPDPFTASSNHPHVLSNTVHERCTFLNLLRSVHLFLVTNKSGLRHCSGGLHCACPSFPGSSCPSPFFFCLLQISCSCFRMRCALTVFFSDRLMVLFYISCLAFDHHLFCSHCSHISSSLLSSQLAAKANFFFAAIDSS